MNTSKIELVRLRITTGDGRVKAFADIRIGDLQINGWRVLKEPGQKAIVTWPMATWKDREGHPRYSALISSTRELKGRIDVAILSAWEKEQINGQCT